MNERSEVAAIIRDIPGMLPDDPALAAVLADAMAEAYADAEPHPSQEPQPLANAVSRRMK